MIELNIKLNDDEVRAAVGKAWAREFSEPGFRDSGGSGWGEVVRQVKAHVSNLELSEMIAASARAQIQGVVDEVVKTALREHAKRCAKEMTIAGTLL